MDMNLLPPWNRSCNDPSKPFADSFRPATGKSGHMCKLLNNGPSKVYKTFHSSWFPNIDYLPIIYPSTCYRFIFIHMYQVWVFHIPTLQQVKLHNTISQCFFFAQADCCFSYSFIQLVVVYFLSWSCCCFSFAQLAYGIWELHFGGMALVQADCYFGFSFAQVNCCFCCFCGVPYSVHFPGS